MQITRKPNPLIDQRAAVSLGLGLRAGGILLASVLSAPVYSAPGDQLASPVTTSSTTPSSTFSAATSATNPTGTLASNLAEVRPAAEKAATEFLEHLRTLPRQAWLDKAQSLTTNWLAAPSMARRLAGAENWSQMSAAEQGLLISETQRTVTRYLLEAAEAYTDQQLQLQDPVSTRATRAKMAMAVTGVPLRAQVEVALDLLQEGGPSDATRTQQSGMQSAPGNHPQSAPQWRIADFSVEGISYAGTKRWQYEVLWRQGGFAAFHQHIKAKNDEFFSAWARVTDAAPEAQGSLTGAPR